MRSTPGAVPVGVSAKATRDDTTARYRWDGELASPADEQAYIQKAWDKTSFRSALFVSVSLLFLLSSFIDYLKLDFSEIFFLLFAIRVLAIAVIALSFHVLAGKTKRTISFFLAMTVVQLLFFATFFIMLTAGEIDIKGSALCTIILLLGFYYGIPNRLVYTLPVCLLVSATELALVLSAEGGMRNDILMVSSLLVAINAAGFCSIRAYNILRRKEYSRIEKYELLAGRLRREISERWQAESAARSSEENFRSVFRASPITMVLVNPLTGEVTLANRAAEDLVGRSADNLSGMHLKDFLLDKNQSIGAIAKLLSRGESFEIQLESNTDSERWVSVSGVTVRYEKKPAVLLCVNDISVRRREAEELKRARDYATAANRSKSEFLANMSHELRTPLNAIIGFSEALGSELFGPVGNDRYKEYIQDIHNSGLHLLNTINDILDLSRIEAGKFDLEEYEVEIDRIFRAVCVIVRPWAEKASVELVVLDQPRLVLHGDERILKQILINLLSNAIEFSPSDAHVEVGFTITDENLGIYVRDHGPGIAPEDIPLALAPFTQVDGSLARAHEGTGLGLPLSRRLAELHGGDLFIESEVGKGTTVWINLPRDRVLVSDEEFVPMPRTVAIPAGRD